MATNYRKEVDSGYDRKVITEKIIMDLLSQGLPPEIIAENSNFNIRHREMLNNLALGYQSKLEQLEDLNNAFYETPFSGLGKDYSEVIHNLQELYPMLPEEEKEKFTRRDELNKAIVKAKNKELKSTKRKREVLINKVAKLKIKHPVLESVIEMVNEMDALILEGPLTTEKMDQLFKKYNFNKSKFTVYNLMYNQYAELMKEISALSSKIEQAENGNITNDEIDALIDEKNNIEEEILKRNLKLINYFIRKKYKKLLVEQEELHDICLIGMANAIRDFDVSKGYKFSTLAFKYMDTNVKRNFKALTGYNWSVYWNRNKIKLMLETTSKLLGKNATIQDLCELGLLDMSYEVAYGYNSTVSIFLDSYLYEDFDFEKNYSTFEDYEEVDNYEDERYSKNSSSDDAVERIVFNTMASSSIADALFTLTDRERIVLTLLYGLDRSLTLNDTEREFFKDYPMERLSYKEVATVFGCSSTNVKFIEAKALRRLRHPTRVEKLKGYI